MSQWFGGVVEIQWPRVPKIYVLKKCMNASHVPMWRIFHLIDDSSRSNWGDEGPCSRLQGEQMRNNDSGFMASLSTLGIWYLTQSYYCSMKSTLGVVPKKADSNDSLLCDDWAEIQGPVSNTGLISDSWWANHTNTFHFISSRFKLGETVGFLSLPFKWQIFWLLFLMGKGESMRFFSLKNNTVSLT